MTVMVMMIMMITACRSSSSATVSLKDSGEKCFETSFGFVLFGEFGLLNNRVLILSLLELGDNAAKAIEVDDVQTIFQVGRDLFQVTVSEVSMNMDFEGDSQVA